MRSRLFAICITIALVACGGTSGAPLQDAILAPEGVDADPPTTSEAGTVGDDSATPTQPDAEGGTKEEAGSPDAGSSDDSATPDAGQPGEDAGGDAGPSEDAGSDGADGANPGSDAGQDAGHDGGSPPVDAGHDTGSDDAGDPPPVDSGSDAADAADSTPPPVDSGPPPVCTDGQADCNGGGGSGNTPRTCVGGQWQSGSPCTFVCTGAGQCTGACTPGTKQCEPGTNNTKTCGSDGQWETPSACSFVCSGAGQCTGSCTPGTKQCDLSNDAETCDGTGTWQITQACPYVCSAGTCEGSCTPGAMDCSGDTPRTCDGTGTWQPGTACPFVCTGAGQCTGSCVPGTKQCSGNQTVTCNASGDWNPPANCPSVSGATPTCSGAGSCGFTCNTGYADCDGNPSNGCEVATSGDSNNCGSCGRGCCGGGACSSGICQPQQLVSGAVATFDMDGTNIYSVPSSRTEIDVTPKIGGTTKPFRTAIHANQVLTGGGIVYWGWVYTGTQYGTYSMPVGGGPITTVNNDGIGKNAFALDSANLFFSDYNSTGGPEIAYYTTLSETTGTTVPASSTLYVETMLSAGTNVYYAENYTPPSGGYDPCSGSLKGSPETSFKWAPVHGGATTGTTPICGEYIQYTKDATSFYYYRKDWSASSFSTGTYSFSLTGTFNPVQITKGEQQPSGRASDGTDLFTCYTGPVNKMPVAGGTATALTTNADQPCSGPVKTDNTCVYYGASAGGGVWTVNKNP